MSVNQKTYDLVEPFDTGSLQVSDIHTLYYEQSGNPVSHFLVTSVIRESLYSY
jgi:hypothetical protein